MRNCNISTRVVFLFNILTVLTLVIYLVDLEKKIAASALQKSSSSIYDLSKLQTAAGMHSNFFLFRCKYILETYIFAFYCKLLFSICRWKKSFLISPKSYLDLQSVYSDTLVVFYLLDAVNFI